MNDINEVKFSGTIERLKEINTKTGNSMASFLLIVGKDKFKCIGFKNVADFLLTCNDGDRVSVTGTGTINSWKDDDGRWHNDFQVTAWGVEVDGKTIAYSKGKSLNQHPVESEQKPLHPDPTSHDTDQYAYRGGPF